MDFRTGARGGIRTPTVARWILNPVRLPDSATLALSLRVFHSEDRKRLHRFVVPNGPWLQTISCLEGHWVHCSDLAREAQNAFSSGEKERGRGGLPSAPPFRMVGRQGLETRTY